MAFNLIQSINMAQPFIQYSPLTAGLGMEPAVSIGTMIRGTTMAAPFTWNWNRKEDSSLTCTINLQDYTLSVTDFGFLEKCSLTDPDDGKIYEIKDVYNTAAQPIATTPTGRPNAIAIISKTYSAVKIRFLSVPDKAYKINLTYQMIAAPMGPFFMSAVVFNPSTNTNSFVGSFDVVSFPASSIATITGWANAGNNGQFVVISCTPTALVVTTTTGVTESLTYPKSAYASNLDWSPIPDMYAYIYHNLFLGEALAMVDDNRSQLYRMRGVAGLLSKAEGLSETQKNAFMQQWMARGVESASVMSRVQQGNQGRAQ